MAHLNEVLSLAHKEWNEANREYEISSSNEAFTKMHIAFQLTAAMKDVLEQLKMALPHFTDFASIAKKIDREMQLKPTADDTYGLQKNIRNDLNLLADMLDDLEKKLPNALRAVNEILEKNTLTELLPLMNETVDSNELAQAQMLQKAQPQPGIFSRIWQALPDPAAWSETTKKWVHTSLLGLQLIDQVSKMVPKPQFLPVQTKELSKEDEEKISREVAFLGNVLTKEMKVLKNTKALDNLTRKASEIKPVLEAIAKYYTQAPSPDDQKMIMGRYEIYRKEMLLNGNSDKSVEWIVQPGIQAAQHIKTPSESSSTLVKTDSIALTTVESSGPFLNSFTTSDPVPLPTVKQDVVDDLKKASIDAKALDQKLRQCSRSEFLKPSLPMTPRALQLLRDELAILRHTLTETMEKKPAEEKTAPEWIEWSLNVQKQRHSLKEG